jgi:exosortase/archaeosortase family protein
MTTRNRAVLYRMVGILSMCTVAFIFLQDPSRTLEARASANVVSLFAPHRTVAIGSSIVVSPPHAAAFIAIVTPACSSLASALAIACLASVVPATTKRRRFGAAIVAVATVVAGNLLRISASLGVGLFAGSSSLVLFHDWAGSVFTYIYVLGGFVLLLFMLLPDLRSSEMGLDANA